MMSKFPGLNHSCRRRYANKLYVGKKNKNKNKNERNICEAVCEAVRKKPREQSSRTVTWQSADFQTTFFRRSNQVGGEATVGRLSNNCFSRYQGIGRIFEKSRWTVTRQWLRSRDRRPTVKQRFWMFQAIRNFFEKSHWMVTRQWSEVTRPSADCQTTFFRRFKQLENFLKKVAERSRDSGRRSRDCRPTVKQRFFDVSSN